MASWLLPRRPDGACVHLGEHGCTVYKQRPAVCRTFDCLWRDGLSRALRPR